MYLLGRRLPWGSIHGGPNGKVVLPEETQEIMKGVGQYYQASLTIDTWNR